MEAPCVRVNREDGERTRRVLAERDLIDRGREITAEDGSLYIPVSNPAAVPEGFSVVTREVPVRETPTVPTELLGFEPSYERLGDIVILHEDDPGRAREIAAAIVASDLRAETVVNRASKVQGEERVREWDVLVGETTETVHREYGCPYLLDIATVYFSPRLATERRRVTAQVAAGERVFDMFAGVGPFVIPAAKRGSTCVGTDVNGDAIAYLRENARRNGVAARVTAIHDDVRGVVSEPPGSSHPSASGSDDGSEDGYRDWADRVVMNLPHTADAFLDTAVALAGEECILHYYDIQPDDDPFAAGERAIREAAGDDYEASVETRRTVRSYAPHEVNVCLDVRLTAR